MSDSLVDYVRYVRGFIVPVRSALDRVSSDEARTAATQLGTSEEDLASAERIWSEVSAIDRRG